MASRDMTANFGADTSSFEEGIDKITAKLNELNKQFVQNQSECKNTSREIKALEREQSDLEDALNKTNNTSREQKEKLLELERASSMSKKAAEEHEKEISNLKEEMAKTNETAEQQKEQLARVTEKLSEAQLKAAGLRTEQTKLKIAIKETSNELDEQTKALNSVKNLDKEAESASEKLKSTIKAQENELEKLKQSYSDVILEQGKGSKEAKKLTDKIRSLSKELNENRTKLDEAAYSSENLDKAMDDAGKSAEESANGGFTVLKGAISNLVSDALNVAIDKFKEMSVSADQSLNSLQVKTGMSAGAVGELKDEMYDIYKNNFGDSLTDVADKMALVVQNIDESDPEKIREITENAIGLSDAFGSDFEENLRGVNGLMTNMGLTADEAFDLIAKGSQNGLDKSHELTDNLAEYSQLWGQAGFSAEEMFSILQNGLDSGAYSLDKVNDLVGEISKSIIDGRLEENIDSFSDKTAQIFKSFKDGKATQSEVFDSMIDDLNNTSNLAEQLATASKSWSALGEDNAMSVITALNNVNDTYKDVSGTMQEINDIQYDDVGSQVEALGRQFEVDILQPIVEQASPKIKEFIEWVSNNLPLVTSSLSALTAGVVTFKTITAATANPYATLVSAILGVVAAVTTLIATNNAATSSISDVKSNVEDYAKAIDDAKSAAAEKEKNTEGDIAVLRTLADEYEELRKKTNRTAEEQNRLDNIAGEIAKTFGTTTDALKDQTGAYMALTGSVDEYISRLKTEMQIENSKDVIKSSQKVLDETEDKYNSVNAEYERIRKFVKVNGREWTGQTLTKENVTELPKDYYGDGNVEDGIRRLNELSRTWADLFIQRSRAQESLDVYTEKLDDALSKGKANNSILDDTNSGLSKQTEMIEDLSYAMSDMESKTNVITAAQNEYKESQKLTASTLQAVINKYPELEDEVYRYMLGLEDAKTLIKSMENVYQDDLNAYIGVIAQKASDSNTFYNQLINANANFVNEAKRQYGVDLLNFKNLQEAKEAMVANTVSKVQGPTQMYTGSFDKQILYNQPNKESWQYKTAESIVNDFIGSAISATTNYTDFFTKNSNGNDKSSVSKATNEAKKAEDSLLKRYELAEAAYNRLIDKRIEKIQKEQEAREKQKNAEIAAIDAEIEARKRLNEDRDIQKELNEVNAQLRYAQLDELSRRELERKRQDLLNEQAEVWWQRRMSDKKDSLQSGYDSFKNGGDAAVAALQKAASSASEYFEELKNGYKSNTQIVNNNSDTRNIQIVQNALSNQQMLDKLLNAIYKK